MFVYFAFFKISHIKYANMLSSYIFFSMATHIHRRNHNSSHKHIDSGSQYSHIYIPYGITQSLQVKYSQRLSTRLCDNKEKTRKMNK